MRIEEWVAHTVERMGGAMIKATDLSPKEGYVKVEFLYGIPRCGSHGCKRPAEYMLFLERALVPLCEEHNES